MTDALQNHKLQRFVYIIILLPLSETNTWFYISPVFCVCQKHMYLEWWVDNSHYKKCVSQGMNSKVKEHI